jgi:hypothetical protein
MNGKMQDLVGPEGCEVIDMNNSGVAMGGDISLFQQWSATYLWKSVGSQAEEINAETINSPVVAQPNQTERLRGEAITDDGTIHGAALFGDHDVRWGFDGVRFSDTSFEKLGTAEYGTFQWCSGSNPWAWLGREVHVWGANSLGNYIGSFSVWGTAAPPSMHWPSNTYTTTCQDGAGGTYEQTWYYASPAQVNGVEVDFFPTDINNFGQVVGIRPGDLSDFAGPFDVVLFGEDPLRTGNDTLGPGLHPRINSASPAAIVGQRLDLPTIWQKSPSLGHYLPQNLNDLLPPAVAKRWVLTGAHDINDHGAIVGAAHHYDLDANGDSILSTKKERAVLLLPVEFEDEEEWSGLDKLSPEKWLMVPQDGDNRAFVLTSPSASSQIALKTIPEDETSIRPDPNNLTAPRTLVTFGVGGLPLDAEGLAIGIGTAFTEDPVLRFSVKVRRELRVTVHPITLVSADGTLQWAPQNTPTKAALEEFLNKTFVEQANIACTVTVTQGARLNWEHGLTTTDAWGKNDGSLDILAPTVGGESLEEVAVRNAIHDGSADVNVYFVARGITFVTRAGNSWAGSQVFGHAGKANRGNRGVIFVSDFPPSSSEPHHRWVIAHEIAHYVGKLDHSTYTWSASHLRGTDNELRLMSGKPGPKRARNPRMLINAEWDKLHEFFTQP